MEIFCASILARFVYKRTILIRNGSIETTTIHARSKDKVAKITMLLSKLDYCPPLYCIFEYHGQLQTAFQFTIRNVLRLCKSIVFKSNSTVFSRELLVLPDGGSIALDWAAQHGSSSPLLEHDSPIVILHHGLVGDSQSEYIYHLSHSLLKSGCRVVVLVARGCGGLQLTSPELFAGRRVSDIAHCVDKVREYFPSAKLFLMGFSLGAALSLQYLAENHDEVLRRSRAGEIHPNPNDPNNKLAAENPLTAALCVSPPWDINRNYTFIASLWLMLIVIPMKLHYLQHREFLNAADPERFKNMTLWNLLWCRNMSQFDALVCSSHYKASGGRYTSLSEYYEDISPIHSAHRILTPTIVLTARDDPLIVHDCAPQQPSELGPGLVVVSSPLFFDYLVVIVAAYDVEYYYYIVYVCMYVCMYTSGYLSMYILFV